MEIEAREETFKILSSEGHKGCSKQACLFKSMDDSKTYKTQHRWPCGGTDCVMKGPDINKLLEIIRNGQIPLLEYDKSSSKVNVRPYERPQTYATISHVWSDGYGNREAAELPECQLEFISSLVQKSKHRGQGDALFWMDTLANPPHIYFEERRLAVQRIKDVYHNAKLTIVLDLALEHVRTGQKYHEIGMRILASGWMRRLWTLQEAYLSKKIEFAFNDEKLMDLDDIEDMYSDAKNSLASNMATLARTYFHHMMGLERQARLFNFYPKNPYDIIASVWRSAQWRVRA